jgi:hypothetical protein
MAFIREFAPAKVNLTLRVHGRHPDGYHRLASLTTFASVGDTLTFEPGLAREVVVFGPFAPASTSKKICRSPPASVAGRQMPRRSSVRSGAPVPRLQLQSIGRCLRRTSERTCPSASRRVRSG